MSAGASIEWHQPPREDDPENWICAMGSYPCDCQGHIRAAGMAWPIYSYGWLMKAYGTVVGWTEIPTAPGYYIQNGD